MDNCPGRGPDIPADLAVRAIQSFAASSDGATGTEGIPTTRSDLGYLKEVGFGRAKEAVRMRQTGSPGMDTEESDNKEPGSYM